MKKIAALLLCVVAVHASKLQVVNDGTTSVPINNVYAVFTSSLPDSGFTYAWGTWSSGATLPPGGTIWAGSSTSGTENAALNGKYVIVAKFASGGSGPPDFSSRLDPGVLMGSSGSTLTFHARTYVVPLKYTLGLKVINNTLADQYYWFKSNGVVIATTVGRIGPGQSWDLLFSDQSATWPFVLGNATGEYPEFSFVGGSGTPWQEADSYVGPLELNHVYKSTAGGTNMAWTLLFDRPPDEAGATNPLSEGTYKAGTENLFTLQKQQGENQLAILRTISDQLGGNTLAQAATNINSAGGSINSASSNVITASEQLNQAANNLGSNIANIGINQGASSNAVDQGKALGMDQNSLSNAVPNPYSDFSLGVTAGGDWGGTHMDNTMGSMWVMTNMGLVGELNLNPILEPHLGPMAPMIRGMIKWASCFALIVFCLKKFQAMITSISAACQAQGTSILGNTWASGIAAALIIVAILAAIPTVWLTFKSGHGANVLAFIATDPLTFLPGSDALKSFFPIDVIILHLGYGFTFWGGCLTAYVVASMGIRVIPR